MDPNRWRLDGQLALVTGGSAGIGLAVVRELLGLGAQVLAVARDGPALERVREELAEEFGDEGIFALAADVADEAQVNAAVESVTSAIGPANVLFNHAGTIIIKSFLETTLEEWEWLMGINVRSMFLMTKAVLPGIASPK